MPKTSVLINIDLGNGTEAKAGSTPAIADVLSQCDLTDLATGAGVARKWASFESNGWLLDGNSHILPASGAHVGVISDSVSDGSGDFSPYPQLTVTFDSDYTLESGITLKFDDVTGDYSPRVGIEFFDVGDSSLGNQEYYPDATEYFCELPTSPLANVRYIEITFLETNNPYRHLRLVDLTYDTVTFTTDVREAETLEQIDPVSVLLPTNTLEFNVFSAAGDFNIVDPQGIYQHLKQKQKVNAYGIIDGTSVYMGRFYLDDWNALTDNEMRLSCIDAIQTMENTRYLGGFYRTPATPLADEIASEDLIADIMTVAGFDYEMDAALEGISIEGWLPVTNCREALQQFCFAVGAYATCSRSNKVRIVQTVLPANASIDQVFTSAEMSLEQSKGLRPLVTAIELYYRVFGRTFGLDNDGDGFPETNVKTILDDSNYLSVGTHVVDLYPDIANAFDSYDPGGTITANVTSVTYGPTYVILTVADAGTWALRQIGFYNPSSLPVVVSLDPSEYKQENKLAIDRGAFITVGNVDTIAQLLFDYYQQRHMKSVKFFGNIIEPGQVVLLDTNLTSKKIRGMIEKITTDLAGGYVSHADIVGSVETVLTAGKYDDDDQALTYTGTWGLAAAGSAYGGSIHYVGTGNSGYVEFSFVGTQFKMIYSQLTDRGSVGVYVDSVLVATVSENGAEDWQHEWTSPVFTDGYHSVKIAHVETGGGDVTDLDAIEVI